MVSKRRSSRYRFDARSDDWLKLAHRHRGSFVVGGWRPQVGTTDRLAALLVGEPTPTACSTAAGSAAASPAPAGARLAALLAPQPRDACPFADEVPRVDARGTFWVEPRVVVDVDTHGLRVRRGCGSRRTRACATT